jgi:hypothetical protein
VDVDRSSRRWNVHWLHGGAWAALFLLIALVALLFRLGPSADGPSIAIVFADGREEVVSIDEMKKLPEVSRGGVYQNQYGNWRDEGVYVGVPLPRLIGMDETYGSIRVVAADGYEAVVERTRVEDEAFPMILAYAFDGLEVPEWGDGFRIAVLPKSGRISNEDYGVESAGSYWVKNVVRIELQ